MMLGKPYGSDMRPWSVADDDPTAEIFSSFGRSVHSDGNASGGDYSPPYLHEALMTLRRYLPSNQSDVGCDGEVFGREMDYPVDAFSCDHFRMFEFKVRWCARGRSHDWTECPYAHPGEKARRRDPRKYHYSGMACPDFRNGSCKRGDSCEFAHGVFECWLHPTHYRTQPCKDGTGCRRRVCFFAHTSEQLRVLPHQAAYSYDVSLLRHPIEASCAKTLTFLSSPTISTPVTHRAESPPLSPIVQSLSRPFGSNPVGEIVTSLRDLQLRKVKSQIGGSPRGSVLRPDGWSLPATPTRSSSRPFCSGYLDFWEQAVEEEPAMERVESGRNLRAKIFEKISKENSINGVHPDSSSAAPNVGWI